MAEPLSCLPHRSVYSFMAETLPPLVVFLNRNSPPPIGHPKPKDRTNPSCIYVQAVAHVDHVQPTIATNAAQYEVISSLKMGFLSLLSLAMSLLLLLGA